jgi:signal transduction histidine kinase
MSRRLLGPVGGPIVFVLVAALVFAGLGWVTYAAIGVERAQREAAARAELGYNLHRALSRLDVRMLSTLWGEDNRQYYDYAPPDPAATPLLVAQLPDWMKLHFQLDASGGWSSPQVLDDTDLAERVQRAWGDPPLPNLNGDRLAVRDDLRRRFPPETACTVFAARELVTASDPLPFAAPFFANEGNTLQQSALQQFDTMQQPQAPPGSGAQSPQPKPSPVENVSGGPPGPCDVDAPLRFFWLNLCWFAEVRAANHLAENQRKEQGQGQLGPDPRQVPQQATFNRGGQRMSQQDDRGYANFLSFAQAMGRGLQEAKNAAGPPVGRGGPYNQLELRNNVYGPGTGNTGNFPVTLPGDKYSNPGMQTQPAGGGGFGPGLPQVPGPGGFGGGGFNQPEKDVKDLDRLRAFDRFALGNLAGVAGKTLWAEREKEEARKAAEELKKRLEADAESAWPSWFGRKKARLVDPVKDADPKPTAPTATLPPPLPPVALHLGSMRPQWITAPDGTRLLVLVRTAKFGDKTVYQGIVIDWPKLQAELRSWVEDLFPDATLVPVEDTSDASVDRAMATLPVQLDPGPQAALPPAGWTPLRIGLVLSWIVAVMAFVVMAFSGWSLIDLAERRIRFVSAVTHELRTPLTSLRLYLDLLVSGMIQDEAKRQEYLKTLALESDRLHRLIDNVLDYAKLEKRKKNGDIKPVRVSELMEQLRATWTDRVAQDGKELVVISTLPPEREVTTDEAMIQQIVGNLIDNARKYTRDAADRRIWVWARPGAGSTVMLEVEDRGPGVPPGERKAIFKPFRRGEHADATAGGAGLGLALAKSWAEVLGARLTYHPADGGTGACFRLELPGK